ncbi:IclR family transcriptional regulator [Rubrobacter calidifluminis]|uniref:IclR family transcriptional regulator n=1 Tax=Rubrobacter calidifluminis TaxID=1392640 RepID=UPI0023620D84|nr:IclR family transcriptional regulator [Rubrobacter calidifluminis]
MTETKKGSAEPRNRGGTESASRVADVLLAFAGEQERLGVSEIARRLGLSKAVVYRILRSLASRQLVIFEEHTRSYRLGPAAATLGARALRDFDLRRAAMPVLSRLQRETGETATISALVGTHRVYLDQVLSLNEIKMSVQIGHPFPLHAGASSRAILAFCMPELRETVLHGTLERLTPGTITNRRRLEEELERVRREGTAISFGERQVGAGSVATPVFGIDGYAIGSLSVCGPVDRFNEETVDRLRPLVREAGLEVSKKLGWEGGVSG